MFDLKKKKILMQFVIFSSIFFILSCDFATPLETVSLNKQKKDFLDKDFGLTFQDERKWNILVYMSADNNLESSALEDICEMELSNVNTDEVSIFVLIDRSTSYDTSENNWSGTRLYRIESKRNENEKRMISQEIECPDLGLFQGESVELDLSSGYVLSKCLSYIMEKFPANDYGLIMWGHGTGWRSSTILNNQENGCENNFSNINKITKGFAFDESAKTYMTLKQLENALKVALEGRKLSFLGFDTCFGGELEIMYELRNFCDYCVASEGLVMSSGWNYTSIFNTFQRCSEKNPDELCQCIVKQFKKQYENTKRASIVCVDMSKMEEYFESFDLFTNKASKMITSKAIRNEVIGILYSNNSCKTEKYTYGGENSDLYLDTFSMVTQLYDYFGDKIEQDYEDFVDIKEKTLLYNWSSDSLEGGLGVYFGTIVSSGLLSTTFPAAYIKGKTYDQIEFIQRSEGYAPTSIEDGSLLDKLFYVEF